MTHQYQGTQAWCDQFDAYSAVEYGNNQVTYPSQMYDSNQRYELTPNVPSSWPESPSSLNEELSRPSSNDSSGPLELRRGRPLIPDTVEEPQRAKEKRQYARKYRETIRAEKCKLKDENEQLKSIIQRFLYVYSILPQNVENEVQKLAKDFGSISRSDKPKTFIPL